MKLNPDCVRAILLYIEENINYEDSNSDLPTELQETTPYLIATNPCFNEYTHGEISYALKLLLEEKYISTKVPPTIIGGRN